MLKFQVGSLVFSLDTYWPLEYSIIYFIFLCIEYDFTVVFLLLFIILLIGIFLLRPYRINSKTSDSYQNHDDFPQKPLI